MQKDELKVEAARAAEREEARLRGSRNQPNVHGQRMSSVYGVEFIWKQRDPTDAESTARFDGVETTFEERSGDRFVEWLGPKEVDDDLLAITAAAMTEMGMSDGAGVSVVRVGDTVGLYLEE